MDALIWLGMTLVAATGLGLLMAIGEAVVALWRKRVQRQRGIDRVSTTDARRITRRMAYYCWRRGGGSDAA